MAWAGSLEKDVYFSTVPSQKSTLSSLATITEQLLWLGGPAPACLTLLLSASLRKPPWLPKIHTQCAKTGGRHTQKQMWLNVFASGENCTNYGVFLSTLVAAVVVEGAGFLNLHVAGCMEPIYHQNNRHAETYMTLPTENSLVSWSTQWPTAKSTFWYFAPYKYMLALEGDDHLVLVQELAWQV